MLALGLRP